MAHTLDYTALNEPLTKADIETYKQNVSTDKIYSISTIASVLILVIVFPLFLVLFLSGLDSGESLIGLGVLIIIPIVILLVIVSALQNDTKRRAKLYKFALRNGLKLISDAVDPGYPGMIFDNGHSRQIKDAFWFSDGTEIGNFSYVTGSGKNQQSYDWGYVKIKLIRQLPHMILDAKGNNFWKFSNLRDSFDRSQVLSLEGDFNKHFTLYAPEQYKRDALYVFTPDVMAALIDHGKGYDIEIVDSDLYIYSNSHFMLEQPEFYEQILAITNLISGELLDQTDYYADERIGNRAVNMVAVEGRRLKSSFNWAVAVAIVLLVYIFIIQPFLFH